MARIVLTPRTRLNYINDYGEAVVDDGFFDIRDWDGRPWPFCILCNRWSDPGHVTGKRHRNKIHWNRVSDAEPQAANDAAGQIVEFEDVPAVDGTAPPQPAQTPQWHLHVEDLHENRVPELERQMTDLHREVEELRQAFKQLMQHKAQVDAVDVINDSGAAHNSSAQSSGDSLKTAEMSPRQHGAASN